MKFEKHKMTWNSHVRWCAAAVPVWCWVTDNGVWVKHSVGVPVRRKRQSTNTTDRQGGGGEKDGGIASGRTRRVRSARVGGRRAAPLVHRRWFRDVWGGGSREARAHWAPPRPAFDFAVNIVVATRHVKCYHHSAARPSEPRPRPTPPDTRNLRSNATTVQQTMYGQRATFTAKN